AEDGIRDFHVTGVQTCALPIYHPCGSISRLRFSTLRRAQAQRLAEHQVLPAKVAAIERAGRRAEPALLGLQREVMRRLAGQDERSEERRVGKECRKRWSE